MHKCRPTAARRVGRSDLIILDLNLGLIDGLVVLRQLGTESRLAGLPIVILTFHIRALDRGTCLAAGANAYWTKPAAWRGFSDIAGDIVRLLGARVPRNMAASAH